MSSDPRSRDQAVTTMRVASAGVVLAGLTLTGGVAGLFAREMATSDSAGAESGDSRQVVVVVRGGPGTAPARGTAAAAAPSVQAPAEPTAPAATSSGSDPS